MNGIATVILSWDDKRLIPANPPRATVNGRRGAPVGEPGDESRQRHVLRKTLTLLEQPAPLAIRVLDGRYD